MAKNELNLTTPVGTIVFSHLLEPSPQFATYDIVLRLPENDVKEIQQKIDAEFEVFYNAEVAKNKSLKKTTEDLPISKSIDKDIMGTITEVPGFVDLKAKQAAEKLVKSKKINFEIVVCDIYGKPYNGPNPWRGSKAQVNFNVAFWTLNNKAGYTLRLKAVCLHEVVEGGFDLNKCGFQFKEAPDALKEMSSGGDETPEFAKP